MSDMLAPFVPAASPERARRAGFDRGEVRGDRLQLRIGIAARLLVHDRRGAFARLEIFHRLEELAARAAGEAGRHAPDAVAVGAVAGEAGGGERASGVRRPVRRRPRVRRGKRRTGKRRKSDRGKTWTASCVLLRRSGRSL